MPKVFLTPVRAARPPSLRRTMTGPAVTEETEVPMVTPDQAFFEASAQLVPLLYLTVAVDLAFASRPPAQALSLTGLASVGHVASALTRWLVFCVSAGGLGASLVVLSTGEVTPTRTVLVVASFATLGLALGIRLLWWAIRVTHSPGTSVPVLFVLTPVALLTLYSVVAWALNSQ